MDIPAVKIEQYLKNKKEFEFEFDLALRTVRVAQVSGLEQQLVDDLYGFVDEHAEEFQMPDDPYLGKHFCLERFAFSSASGKGKVMRRKMPYINKLIKGIRQNLSEIAHTITKSADALYGPMEKPRELWMFGYYQKKGLTFSDDHKKKVMIEKHRDSVSSFTIAPSASTNGLEGYIHSKWVPLQPEKGYVLVWAGSGLDLIYGPKPLVHRVIYPDSDRYALLYF